MLHLTPRISEKSYALAQTGTYVFNVPLDTNKHQVSQAIAEQFNVGVSDVRLVIAKGKSVRAYRGKRRNPGVATRKDTKKAYVRLAKGDVIEIFKEEETK